MKIFRPWKYVAMINDIDVEELKLIGIKLILFDFDNTLAKHHSVKLETDKINYLKLIEENEISVYILSNARKNRIKKVLEDLELRGRGMSIKPFPFVINKVIKEFGFDHTEVVLVGDQILTDVISGNLSKIKTILVDRLDDDENRLIRLRRKIESYIIKRRYNVD